MKLNEIRDNPGARHARKRVGRGEGSGIGKTCGRGHKGQKSRTGVAIKGFEGGQMPLYMRLPKRGFSNVERHKNFKLINFTQLQKAIDDKKIDPSKQVTHTELVQAGLVGEKDKLIKLLNEGELKQAIDIVVSKASNAACKVVEEVKGKVSQTITA